MSKAAGHHVRRETKKLARIGLALILVLLVGMLWAWSQYGLTNPAFIPTALFVIACLWLVNRFLVRRVERFAQGATGEEQVGAALEGLVEKGWRVIHDVDLGSKGNIDHVLVGPAGILTVETKSHKGRIAARKVPRQWLSQAYAQAKRVERITQEDVSPLLVFSRAWLDAPATRNRGVVLLPARMIEGHFARRPFKWDEDHVNKIYARLAAALDC
jgi:flagellar biosynthesis protein FliQ